VSCSNWKFRECCESDVACGGHAQLRAVLADDWSCPVRGRQHGNGGNGGNGPRRKTKMSYNAKPGGPWPALVEKPQFA
jgi:hypothetical protein